MHLLASNSWDDATTRLTLRTNSAPRSGRCESCIPMQTPWRDQTEVGDFRRLVLLILLVISPISIAALVYETPPESRDFVLLLVGIAQATRLLWALLCRSAHGSAWFFPLVVLPNTCVLLASWACPHSALPFLVLSVATVGWTAVLLSSQFVIAAIAVSTATVFTVMARQLDWSHALMGTALYGSVTFMLAHTAYQKSFQLRRARRALAISAARDHSMLMAIPDVVIRARSNGIVLDVHAPPGAPLPVAAEDMIGKHVWAQLPPDLQPLLRRTIDRACQTGHVQEAEYSITQGGRTLVFNTRVAHSDEGELTIVRQDITARHSAQLQAANATGELERTSLQLKRAVNYAKLATNQAQLATRYKDDFLANMSHELRTPMNGILGMTGLLLDSELTDKQKTYVELARSNAENLLVLINRLLDFSRLESQGLELELVEFDLRGMLEDSVAMFATLARSKRLELVTMIDTSLQGRVTADADRLRQVVVALLENAVKFTHEGFVKLTATCKRDKLGQARLHLEVIDSGIGIPWDQTEAVFLPFMQADGSRTRRYGGAGLGLAIANNIASLMGGEITVLSQPHQGSTFRLVVPIAVADGSHAEVLPLQGKRVLLVSGSDAMRDGLGFLFSSLGAILQSVSTDSDALQVLQSHSTPSNCPDLVAIDVPVSQKAGSPPDLAAQIRDTPEWTNIRIASFVSHCGSGSVACLDTCPTSSCLTKPIRTNRVIRQLQLLFTQGQKGDDAPLSQRWSDQLGLTRRVLVIDDDATNQAVLSSMLRKTGHVVDVSSSGPEALRLLRQVTYHLIIVDCDMPGMDGFATAQEIRRGESGILNNTMSIIAMSHETSDAVRATCLKAGINAVVSKPVQSDALYSAMAMLVSEARIKMAGEPDESVTRLCVGNCAAVKGVNSGA